MVARIVVGVDGSPGSLAALEWAVDEARRRQARLDVVHVWDVPMLAYSAITPVVTGIDEGELESAAREVLDKLVAGLPHDVTVEPILARGTAASVLLETARGADLVVVGSRGHGGFVGLLLGSVSAALAHHSPCPVVIVRHQD